MMPKPCAMAATLLVLLLAVAGRGANAVDLASFVSDPKYSGFLMKAMQTNCLTDPAVTGGTFDLDLCPSLLGMLDAVNTGATEYPGLTCEPACAGTFDALGDTCFSELSNQFLVDPAPLGVLGSQHLQMCVQVSNTVGASPAPAASPAPMGPSEARAPGPGDGMMAPTPAPAMAPAL